MANQIEREAWVKQDKLKNPIHYVRGTDLLPIVFHFRDFSIPSGVTARVFVAKPDGNAVYGSATISGNDVTVDVQQQMFIVLGLSMLQVEIKSGEKTLATFVQPVMVEQNLKAGDLPESTTDISFLDDAIEQANQAVNTATTAASQAAQAVQNANQAIADANKAISDLNEQIASLNTNFALLSNNVSISQLDTTAKTIVGALNELNSNMTVETGTWTPVLTAGVEVTQGNGSYYKIGRLVICNVAIWIDSSEATDEDLTISLPFISNHDRSYGTVGYLNPFDFPNLCVGVVGKTNIANLIYTNTSGGTVSIKGNQIRTSIQFTITYVTS